MAIFRSLHNQVMRICFVFLLLLLPIGLSAQFSTAVQKLAPGGMAFFTDWQTGILNNNNGIQSTFSGYDEVHALLVPRDGMASLPPGANAFLVEILMDEAQVLEVPVELPPLGPQHSAIAIPLYPSVRNNVLPELAGTFELLFKRLSRNQLQHTFRIRVYLAEGKRYLAEGGFATDASFVGDRFGAEEDLPPVADQALDGETEAYIRDILAKDYSHLRLLNLHFVRPWPAEAQQGGTHVCVVRYVVQDARGVCFSGASQLSRKFKKNGEAGKINGVLWPNVRTSCE